MENKRIVAVSFQCAGKLFDFDARDLELADHDKVIVETERGKAMGTVIGPLREELPANGQSKHKSVLRKVNDHDLEMAEKNAAREEEALHFCKRRVSERGLAMKLVRAEYLFDGSKIVFFFTADGRIDFRELVRDLAQHFRTRIEMRQIGVRDEAKIVGGLGCCGRELCCCSYMRNFSPVSVKMAKAQGLALNPSKISGQCGRLLCCLGYEYETYNELLKGMPKCGKKIQLGEETASVVGVNILSQKVTIMDKDGRRDLTLEELKNPDKTRIQQEPECKTEKVQRPENSDKKTTQKADKPPRRRRGGRANRQRNTAGQAPSAEQQAAQERPAQETAAKEDRGQSKAGGEQKTGRNRRRRNRRPRRRAAQTTPDKS